MSTLKNDNAFPMVVSSASSEAHNGLTKREYFAAILFAGILSDPQTSADAEHARMAVKGATLLIEELNK